jgi:hypothetical protein
MNAWVRTVVRTLIVLLPVSAHVVLADDFGIDWFTVDGGGKMLSTGGEFELSGSIGQPDAGAAAMTGGDFELAGGFWPGTCFLLGDLDRNGSVELSDLAQLLANYGITSGAAYEDGDLNGDAAVSLSDLAELLAHYGETCP